MTQYYVNFNDIGKIIGFYVDDIHGDSVPVTAKPISVEDWKVFSTEASLYKLDGEVIRLKTQAELDQEYVMPEPLPKTDEQLRLEQLEVENVKLKADAVGLNNMVVELWEVVIPLIEGGEV